MCIQSDEFCRAFAYFLAFITFWNCVKVPFYVVLFPATAVENSTTLPFGMENSVPFCKFTTPPQLDLQGCV